MKTVIRPVSPGDNEAMAGIIRTVMPEFGAGGAGFAIHDEEVDDMFGAYSRPRCAYFVCELDGAIVGGGGVAPLEGGDEDLCELKKMYFLPDARGHGLGDAVLSRCLEAARSFGFQRCYLETFNTMNRAMRLYERKGFRPVKEAMGNTGHFACDRFYVMAL